MKIDAKIIEALSLSSTSTISPHGGSGFSNTYKITNPDSKKQFFVKTGAGEEARVMFEGEYESLRSISSVSPTLCPKPLSHGPLSSSSFQYYLATSFLPLSSSSSKLSSLAKKLAHLHSTPDPRNTSNQFGFPIPTSCGATVQPNTLTSSWSDFFATHRLRFIINEIESKQGRDPELRGVVENVASLVVPRLISAVESHAPIKPVVVHGDLWSGNAGYVAAGDGEGDGGGGKGRSVKDEPGEVEGGVVFDPSSCWAHHEYEFGIMRMFGGFSEDGFWKEYRKTVKRVEPVEEEGDRVRMYELYHQLNHTALFGGSYRGAAMRLGRGLIEKYGKE